MRTDRDSSRAVNCPACGKVLNVSRSQIKATCPNCRETVKLPESKRGPLEATRRN